MRDNTSIENQGVHCRTYAAEQEPPVEIAPENVWIDRGVSGATFGRDGWGALRQAVEAGQIGALFIYALDRLGRTEDPGDMFEARTFCIRHGVRVYSVSERLEVTSVEEIDLWRFFIGSMQARRERLDIIRRTGQGQKAAAARSPDCHAYGGRPPFGYRSERGVFVADGASSPIVRRVFGLAAGGATCEGIAAQLNEENMPAPGGGRWHANTVRRLLRNPAFAGEGIEVGYTDVDTKESHRAVFPAPALVEYNVFNAARRQMALRKQVHTVHRLDVFWLSGIPECAICRRPMTGTGRQGYRYYTCGARSRYKQMGLARPCPMPIVPAAALEGPVWADLRGVLDNPALLSAALADGPDTQAIDGRLAQIEREIAGKTVAQTRLALDFAREVLGESALKAAAGTLASEIEELGREAAGLQMRRMAMSRLSDRVARADLDQLPPAARAELAHELIARIETRVVNGGVSVTPYYWLLPVDELNRSVLSIHTNALTAATPEILIEL